MDAILKSFLDSVSYHTGFIHGSMEVIPLFSSLQEGLEYSMLGKALSENTLVITEVSESGSVPRLKVINGGRFPVLLLDGEELAGAKQNRVLNTSILVPAGAELVVPVSCTEQGRWTYQSPVFTDSRVMMEHVIRQKKMASVSHSLRSHASRAADQVEIWDGISHMSARARVHSRTRAMRDIYESSRGRVDEYQKAFPLQPGQSGILVFLDNQVAGCEFISRPDAYAQVHEKLISSYALEAALGEERAGLCHEDLEEADRFLAMVSACRKEAYPGAGLGTEYRLEGAGLVGSALVHDGEVIHLALFSAADPVQDPGEVPGGQRHAARFRTPHNRRRP
jgi:hypothetical protein